MRIEPIGCIGSEPYYVRSVGAVWSVSSVRRKAIDDNLPKDRTFEYILKHEMEKLRTEK